MWALYLAAACALLSGAGAFRSEFAGYPDEPSHYLNGMLIRDYALHGNLQSPVRFAIHYYLHYPKVTFGHWPPLFYVLEAAWMLVFSSSRVSVLLMMAVWTAALAFSIWKLAAIRCGRAAAFFVALIFVLLPLTQEQLSMVMTEIPLALFCLWAAAAWARYLADGRRRDAVWFGAWACAAIMVKGDAWALAPAAAIAALAAGRIRRAAEPRFWIPAAMVALICVPYYWRTRAWAALGWTGGTTLSWKFTSNAAAELAAIIPGELGWPLIAAAAAGVVVFLARRASRRDPLLCSLAAFLASAAVFEVVIPAGMEARKMCVFLPEAMIFAAVAIAEAGGALRMWPKARAACAAAVALLALFLVTDFRLIQRYDRGFRELARTLHSRFGDQKIAVLVSSSGPFEGLMVSEMAAIAVYPSVYVLRASEVLTDVEWIGPEKLYYHTPEEIDAELRRIHTRVLVVHSISGRPPLSRSHVLLEELAARKSPQWSSLFEKQTRTDRGLERLRAWELGGAAGEPDIGAVWKRLQEKRLVPAKVTID